MQLSVSNATNAVITVKRLREDPGQVIALLPSLPAWPRGSGGRGTIALVSIVSAKPTERVSQEGGSRAPPSVWGPPMKESARFEDTTPILGPVCARHHLNLRIVSAQICALLTELDAAICTRDHARWSAALQALSERAVHLPAAIDRVCSSMDTAGEA